MLARTFIRTSTTASFVSAAVARSAPLQTAQSASQTAKESTRSFASFSAFSPKTTFAQQTSFQQTSPVFKRTTRLYSTPTASHPIDKIRNFAIIAHVDHGKTTLVDKILRESATVTESDGERVMDSNTLEQERGITIMAKNTSLKWNDYKFNIIDTPGHSDFGGEVERILTMVDGVILLVDCMEGPMTQTKFVLSKALKKNLPAIVLINKMDRDTTNRERVEGLIFDLFIELGASEEQMTYQTLYASAKAGWAVDDMSKPKQGMKDLFDAIVKNIPAPAAERDKPFSMLVTTLDYDEHLGKLLVGRITSGSVHPGDKIKALSRDSKQIGEGTVMKLLAKHGLKYQITDLGEAGDIVAVAGFGDLGVSETLCDMSVTRALQSDPIDPPVLSMTFAVNNSPIAGKEGKIFSAMHIRERLEKEAARNVTITINNSSERSDEIIVSGRGELQISILIENMRREGFEISVSPPQVIFKIEDGQKYEPLEEVIIDVENEHTGAVLEMMRQREADVISMVQGDSKTRITFHATSRSLIGLRAELINATRGMAVFNHIFLEYTEYTGAAPQIRKGVLVSLEEGVASSYALKSIESRGILFIAPQEKVYEGMIVGENSKAGDLDVNPTKSKQLTNFRTTTKDDFFKLTPPKLFSLEEAIAYIQEDELIEVTPKSIRLRKRILDTGARERARKSGKKA